MYALHLLCFFLLIALYLLFGTNNALLSIIEDYAQPMKRLDNLYGAYSYLFVVGIGPFIEEVVFRLCLYPLRVYAATSIAGLVFILSGVIWSVDYQSTLFYFRILGTLTVGIISYSLFSNQLLQKLYTKYYPAIFYSSALLFGLMHLLRFQELKPQSAFIYVLIITLISVNGIILGYTRLKLKYGFWWAVVLHGLMNAKLGAALLIF